MFELERVALEKFLGLFDAHRDAVNLKMLSFGETILFSGKNFSY